MVFRTQPTKAALIALYGLGMAFLSHPALADDGDDVPLGQYQDQPREWITRDRDGHQTGRIEEKSWGAAVYDRNGRAAGYIEQAPTGEWIQRDNAGRRVGTIERR